MQRVYTVHSIFHTVQGEGFHSGKRAVFVRFAGCNLWSGREQDRHKAICKFCDTQFRGGTRYSLDGLIDAICAISTDFVVFTGGEPSLQLDRKLVVGLQRRHRYVAVETNGTRKIPDDVDWICVSPKAGTTLTEQYVNEVKLVYPQVGYEPWQALGFIRAQHYWLSPMAGPNYVENARKAVEYAKFDPRWRVTIQAHKFWGIE